MDAKSEKKKKGRTMSKEMLEKLALARAKGLAKIQENRKKFKELQAKEHDSDQEDKSDHSLNSIMEKPPPPKATKPPKVADKEIKPPQVAKTTTPTPTPQAKYNGVRKIKKTKVIYLTDSETEEEVTIAKPPRKTPPKAQPPPQEEEDLSLEREYTKINSLLTKYNM